MTNEAMIGATLSASGITAKQTTTDKLKIGEREITEISTEADNASVNALVTGKALVEGLEELDESIKQIDPNNNFFKDNTVITLPLIDMTFSEDSDWDISGWIPHDGMVSYTGPTIPAENYVGIPTALIPFAGSYFFAVDIPRLDSGRIHLVNEDDQIVKTFTEYGKFPVEAVVTNADIAQYKFRAEGVFPGEVITIASVLFSRITPRMKEYMNYLFTGGGGELTYQQVVDAIATSATNILATVNGTVNPLAFEVSDHISNSENPHNTTYQQTGAASAGHTHNPASIGAAAVTHGHEPEECGAAPVSHSHTPAECDAAPATHTHTPSSIGAAAASHTHTPDECGAAAAEHTHAPESIGAATTEHTHSQYLTASDVETAVVDAIQGLEFGSTKIVKPYTISEIRQGMLPPGYEEEGFTKPVFHAKFPYLIHQAKGLFDPYEGFIESNVESSSLVYAFKKHLTAADEITQVAEFDTTTAILAKPVKLSYTFHQPRTINKFTLYKHAVNSFMSVPTEVALYVDDVLITTATGEVETPYSYWAESLPFWEILLAEEVTGSKFTFVITRVAQIASLTNWGARIDFGFTDAAETLLAYPNTITRNPVSSLGTYVDTLTDIGSVAIGADPDPLTPVFVYLSDESVGEGKVINLRTSYLPFEVGTEESGVDVYTNKFNGKAHPYFGNLTVSSENGANVGENIYTDDSSKYWEILGTGATFEHVMTTPLDLMGYRLEFTKDMADADTIPDAWSLTVTYENDTVNLLHSVNNYSPSIQQNANKNIVFTVKDLSNHGKIKAMTLALTGSVGQTSLALCRFVPVFRTSFYNPAGNTTTAPTLFPFGILRPIEAYDGSWKGYRHEGLVVGDSCQLQIDGLALQPNANIDHVLVNPFFSTDIRAEVVIHSDPDGLSPAAEITKIRADFITVQTRGAGRYSLKLKRNW